MDKKNTDLENNNEETNPADCTAKSMWVVSKGEKEWTITHWFLALVLGRWCKPLTHQLREFRKNLSFKTKE